MGRGWKQGCGGRGGGQEDRHGAQSTSRAELSPLCAPGPRTWVPRAAGRGRGLGPHPGRPQLRFCSACFALCLAVSASPQPGEFASGCCSEAPEGTAASGWGESPRGEGWLWLPGASPPHSRAGPPASLVNSPQDEQRPTLGSRAPKLGCSKTKSQSKAGPHTATSRGRPLARSLPAHLPALTHTLLPPQKTTQRPWCPCILNGTGCSATTV